MDVLLPEKILPVLLAAFAVPALGAASHPIRLEQVARAVLAAHPELAGAAIALPEAPTARENEPALAAGPVERWGSQPGTAHVRMRCQVESVCLPFYASVHLAPSQGEARSQEVREAQPVLRAGERASMVIDSGRLHLRIPVTCLTSGAVGSTIRVAGPARSKVFEAAVLDKSTVRGEL